MSPLTAGGIVPSIVPFDPTAGVAVVATVMLAVFVLAMMFLALAPIVSESWADQLSATTTTPSRGAEPSDD